MTLAKWISAADLTDAEFARRLGISRQALSRYKAGTRIPRPHILHRIMSLTNGAVTANDFVFVASRERAA